MKTETHLEVQQYYGNKARTGSSCCNNSPDAFYSAELIEGLPAEIADFTLGCGNPISLANLQPGETVLDLGSGGGLDCFLAAREVGSTGNVIGVDMTADMLERAEAARARLGYNQVEFRMGYLEDLPLPDASVDVIISNCVVNLSPDKPRVFAEMARVLKPGGRIAISDIVTHDGVDAELAAQQDAWSACAAGAVAISDWETGLAGSGFEQVEINAKNGAGDLLPDYPTVDLFSALISATKIA